jgi:hypothetical protein
MRSADVVAMSKFDLADGDTALVDDARKSSSCWRGDGIDGLSAVVAERCLKLFQMTTV